MLWLNILFLKYYTLMALRFQSQEQHLFVYRSQILIEGTHQIVGVPFIRPMMWQTPPTLAHLGFGEDGHGAKTHKQGGPGD